MMQILVDADACPQQIQKLIVELAKAAKQKCLFISNYAHFSINDNQEFLYVDRSFQAVDLVIANRVAAGDVVVTQDYGLAALVLAKGAQAISTRGMVYADQQIDQLLEQRHLMAKIRRGGGRHSGPAKISQEDLERFRKNFASLLGLYNKEG